MWEYNCTELFDHESSRNVTYLCTCDKIVGFPFQQVFPKVKGDCDSANSDEEGFLICTACILAILNGNKEMEWGDAFCLQDTQHAAVVLTNASPLLFLWL